MSTQQHLVGIPQLRKAVHFVITRRAARSAVAPYQFHDCRGPLATALPESRVQCANKY
jgi:hypothetical protein